MRKGLPWILGLWISTGSAALAQSLGPPVDRLPPAETKLPAVAASSPGEGSLGPPAESSPAVETICLADLAAKCPAVDIACQSDCGDRYRVWARGDYLLWWVKNTPLPVPVVTTGDPTLSANAGIPISGAIGQPGTQVLLGNEGRSFNAFSGMRITIGALVGDGQDLSVEASGFLLERRTSVFTAGSDPFGNPPLYFPLYNVAAGREGGLPISDPRAGFAGNVTVTSSLQLWGTEINGCLTLMRKPGLEIALLGGLRYMDLQENLAIHNSTTDLLFLNTTVANDNFGTRNQFYGGQLGTRVSLQSGPLSLDLAGKLALGATHEVVNIQGDATQTALPGGFAPTPGSFPGGIFAQPSNIGRRVADEFSVIPVLELKVGYQLTPQLRLSMGYDFVYWNQVVRPGSQLDHNGNPNQSPIFNQGGLLTPVAPAAMFQRSDFWAQGLSLGLEFRF